MRLPKNIKRLYYWLRLRGYSGLVNSEGECGCAIEDLIPCGEPDSLSDCRPGYKVMCNKECTHSAAEECRAAGSFHIQMEKP